MDIVRPAVSKGVTFADLEPGKVYITGPKNNQVWLCVSVPHASLVKIEEPRYRKRLVRLEDATMWGVDDFQSHEFAPVVVKVVIE